MGHYILQYTEGLAAPAEEMERARGFAELTVLDETPRMLLVEVSSEWLPALQELLPGWLISPEVAYPLPTTRVSSREPD